MKLYRPILLAVGLLASFATGSATTIATYMDDSFTVVSTGGYSSVAASYADSSITASTFVNNIASGSTNSNANFSTAFYDAYAKSTYLPGGSNGSGSSYLSFNVTQNGSIPLYLSSLTFTYGGQNSSTSTAYTFVPQYTVVYSSDSSFATSTTLGTGSVSLSLGKATVASPSNIPYRDVDNAATIDLSSIAGLTTGQQIYFRINLTDGGATKTNNANVSFRLDTVVLNGTIGSSIPEPSTYALLLGGLTFGFVYLRRRRA